MEVNVLIAFYSRYGNVRALAETIAEGAREVQGVNIRMRRAADLAPEEVIAHDPRWAAARKEMTEAYSEPTNDDLAWADVIFFGTPTRYGNPTAEMKLVIDKTGPLWVQGALVDKVASVFTSTSTIHGGNESTIIAMLNPLMHLGMIVVTPGYADPIMFQAGTPYGASSVSGPNADQPPTEADLAVARFTGKRVTEHGLMLKLGKEALAKQQA
ncbi:MAG: NAD(P)H:quinone oxidoreductase [Armatimonadota bacterium]|nr:NAD(P)H:quinone oxidoreductase [bacterium]